MHIHGYFVSRHGHTMTLSHEGSPDTEHEIKPGAVVVLNHQPALPNDLQVGDRVALTGDPADSISITR